MDKEKLKADKEKYIKELEIFTRQDQSMQINIRRLEGVIAYINECLKEMEDAGLQKGI
ncbi:MAG: hypothetical protein PHV11_03800 [Candidatus Bipolaricaulis sp.]|nr:hypothetical protein [Candidatus Bipolaricaulis sp.]